MKKTILLAIFCMLIGTSENVFCQTPRRTGILAGDEILREITSKNMSITSGGVMTIDVSQLASPVKIGDFDVYLRSTDGQLEFSPDNSTWFDLLALPYTEEILFTIGEGAVTGTVALQFAGNDALRYDIDTSTLEFWDGAAWEAVGSGEIGTVTDGTNTVVDVLTLHFDGVSSGFVVTDNGSGEAYITIPNFMDKTVYDSDDNGVVDEVDAVSQLDDGSNVVTAEEIVQHIGNDAIHGGGGAGVFAELVYEWQINGAVVSGTAIDLPRRIMLPGTLSSIEVFLEDTGTGGDALVVDIDNDGTSIFSTGGIKPTISANSGSYQTNTATDIGETTVFTGDIVTFDIETAPENAADLHIVLRQQIAASSEHIKEYQWLVSGAIVTGVQDNARYVSESGKLLRYYCLLEDTGTGGNAFVADLLDNAVSVFSAGGTKPSIAANSGTYQVSETSLFGEEILLNGSILEFDVDTVPDSAENVVCTAEQLIPKTLYVVYTWKVSGVVVPLSAIDVSRVIANDGVLIAASAILEDTGTGGDALVLDVNVDGVSVYAGGGSPPSILANSGSRQSVVSSDMATNIVSQGAIVNIDIDTAPTSAEGLTIQLIQQVL